MVKLNQVRYLLWAALAIDPRDKLEPVSLLFAYDS